jgi:hypothetical protein
VRFGRAATIAFALAAASVAEAQDAVETTAPKIGEIMVMQQVRHIKLWFAGQAGNWPLADYEIDQLKDGFDAVDQQLGGDTVAKAVGTALSAVEKSIDSKDRAAFTSAYDRLTSGCNSCHRMLDHAFVVIGRPTLSPYSDQVFAPRK